LPPLIPRDESDGLRRFVPSREQFLKPVGDFRPALMVALWLWATAEGVGSARQLERLCAEHLAYRLLCGGVEIDHRALSSIGRVGDTFSSLSTPIAVTLVISSRRDWLIGRSADYGNHSPNNGKYPPNEAAYQSSEN